MAINVINGFPSIPQIPGIQKKQPGNDSIKEQSSVSFESIFKQKTEENAGLKISKHANERLTRRNIDLSDDQWQRLESGVRKAEMKGIRESLIMVDDVAFIVNVSKSTVITAVDEGEHMIFTNIDGAVIV